MMGREKFPLKEAGGVQREGGKKYTLLFGVIVFGG